MNKTEQIKSESLVEADITAIHENPENPRTISKDKFEKLRKSVREFPEMLKARPIVVNPDLMVLGGNMRLKALKAEGHKKVWIYIADWVASKNDEFIIKDNVGFGEWDWDALGNEWDHDELIDWGVDIPVFPNQDDIEEECFEVPASIETKIVTGDLIEIGSHRLLCGDSTNKSDVNKLLDGTEPYLMVTDPPYGVNYDADWRNHTKDIGRSGRAVGRVQNDDVMDWTSAWRLSPSSVVYVYHDGKFSGALGTHLSDAGYDIRSQIIWLKNNIVISRGHYHWKHEPCWYAVKKGASAKWKGDRKQNTIWEIEKPLKSETGHSTQKPIECMARPMRNHEGDAYDPFLGSGTTMVAAHQLNRRCYGIEIDPKYCQVIVDRMRSLDPGLIIKKNGKSI